MTSAESRWGAAAYSVAVLFAAAICVFFFWSQFHYLGDDPNRVFVGLWSVFPALGRGFSWGREPFPFLPLVGALVAVGLMVAIGRLFLRCADFYAPARARNWLALLFGLSIWGIVLEPFAIFKILYPPVVWAVSLLLLVGLRIVSMRRERAHPETGQRDPNAHAMRRALRQSEQESFAKSLTRPSGFGARIYYGIAIGIISLISLLTFYHAVLYPETYWDALILYLGYARMTYLEHGFHTKVVAQVGIGLGANYPHLFPLIGASISSLWWHWSPIYQQFLAPLLGLGSTVLIYHTALRLTRHVNLSVSVALLFRSIPYVIAYNIWSSDYALAMALAAAFAYLALAYLETARFSWLIGLTLLAAAGTRINYLMWAFWPLWGLVVGLAHWRSQGAETVVSELDEGSPAREADPGFTLADPRSPLRRVLLTRRYWVALGIGIALSLPWYVRNEIVAGNPFYAFFPGILGGKNINPEVLDSAFGEWRSNGDGIGVVAEQYYQSRSMLSKILTTPYYFVVWQSRWNKFWKLAPVFVAFCVPGVLFWLLSCLSARRRKPRRRAGIDGETFHVPLRFGVVLAAMGFGFLFYFYALGDFYLYQALPMVPAFCLFAAYWPVPLQRASIRAFYYLLTLAVGIMPGIAAALMGPKLSSAEDPLVAFREPLMRSDMFYERVFPGAAQMWEYVNVFLQDKKLLTHDNRHLMFDPTIELIHLDDWELQPLYAIASPEERASRLKTMGIKYYLWIPMEDRHAINRRLGMRELLDKGLMRLDYKTGEDSGNPHYLYELL